MAPVIAHIELKQIIEVAKEFGGGFVAYWMHHVFHRVWHATGYLKFIWKRPPKV